MNEEREKKEKSVFIIVGNKKFCLKRRDVLE